jgi:hypothetical protein
MVRRCARTRAGSRDPPGANRCSTSGRRRRRSTQTETPDRRSRRLPTLRVRSPGGPRRRRLANRYGPGGRKPHGIRALCRSTPGDFGRSVREREVGNRADRRAGRGRTPGRPRRPGQGDERGHDGGQQHRQRRSPACRPASRAPRQSHPGQPNPRDVGAAGRAGRAEPSRRSQPVRAATHGSRCRSVAPPRAGWPDSIWSGSDEPGVGHRRCGPGAGGLGRLIWAR